MRRLGLVLLVALVFALTGPVTAGAQLQTFGSTLASPSNLAFGCEAVPTIVDVGGNQAPVASGAPDCTWANTGGGTIPGDGTVTRITIKSGPNPAPIRFVVLRTLAQPGMGSFCCFFVAETSVSQPAPNSVQSFNVNLPVERNTNPATQVMSQDNIGVSAAAGTGTLPVFDNGRHNILDPINPALNASFYYPRVSSATDTGSGVRATGSAGGYEVLLQDQFCPKGQEAACGIGGGGGGGNGGGNGGGGGGNGGGGGGDTAPPRSPSRGSFRPSSALGRRRPRSRRPRAERRCRSCSRRRLSRRSGSSAAAAGGGSRASVGPSAAARAGGAHAGRAPERR